MTPKPSQTKHDAHPMPIPDDVLKQLTRDLETLRQQRDLPSLSAAVALEGDAMWQSACGLATLETRRPATPDMVYPLGSISKVFVATMLMQLVERGVVALEDPLAEYLPEYRVHAPFRGTPPTTLRQLAAHTSGLPRDAAINFPMNHSLAAWEFSDGQAPLQWYASAEAILASLPTVELEIPPDTAKVYSNLGIMLLGIALERACGQDIRRYITERIFAPLGMTSAGFVDDDGAWDERFPTGYGRSSSGGAPFVAPRWQLGGAFYTGGIYATAADLARFCVAFMREDSPLLGAASINRMIHPSAMGDTNLGWWRGWHAGRANFGHAGAHVGYISAALFIPDLKLAVAVQTNRWNPVRDTGDSTEVARELLARLIPVVEQHRRPYDPGAVDLARYAGAYTLPGGYASADVAVQGDELDITLRGVPAAPLRFAPVRPHQFGPPGTTIPAIQFQADAQGSITGLDYALFRFAKRSSLVRETYVTTSDGVTLYVAVKGQGTPCLYLHGGPGSGSHWTETFAGPVLERHFQMVYLDQRGVARSSSPPGGDYSPERMVQDFEEVRLALGIDRWLTMGHSFGGILQMEYVQRHPETVSGMLMLNCVLNLLDTFPDAVRQACSFLDDPDLDLCTNDALPIFDRLVGVYGRMRDRGLFWKMGYASLENSQRMDASFGDIPNWNHEQENEIDVDRYMANYKPSTASIAAPVLFFYGKTDWMIGPEHYRGVQFPNMLLWPSDVGHVAALENLADLEAAIIAYRDRFGL